MNNKTDIDVQYVSPLKKICMTIGELPASYLETMSYYEMLVWFTEFLKNQVIPTVNNNAEAVSELQALYEELRIYVNNYFDNLDVQDEIDNKLEEMADSGQLTDIIAQYLGLAGMIAFDTVADMKLAENLVNGSKCQTLGFYQANDGGGSIYKIRSVTNSDVIDERRIIALYDENLVGELIINSNEINPKQFGAYCDGTHDDSDALNACLSYTNNLSSSNGTFKRIIKIPAIMRITQTINCKIDQFRMEGDSLNNSRIVLDGENAKIVFGKDDNANSYEIEIFNIKFYGNHNNNDSLLTFNKCNNIYLTRVETAEGGENQYNIKFNNSGLIFMDECTITGSNNVHDYPGNRNGIYFNNIGSIFNISHANCWNLDTIFYFNGNIQNINIENNWMECMKTVIKIDGQADNRYMNFKINNNTINTHTQDTFIPSTFSLFDYDVKANTNFFGSNVTINDNTIYLANVTNIKNNSLINLTSIGNSENSLFTINYNRNIFSGQNLNGLSAYLFTNTDTSFNTGLNVRINSFTVGCPLSDKDRLSDFQRIIACGFSGVRARVYNFPNGVYLGNNSSTLNSGNLYYDNGEFYGGYAGTAKTLPKNVGTAIPYATSENYISVINNIVTALSQAHITTIQS